MLRSASESILLQFSWLIVLAAIPLSGFGREIPFHKDAALGLGKLVQTFLYQHESPEAVGQKTEYRVIEEIYSSEPNVFTAKNVIGYIVQPADKPKEIIVIFRDTASIGFWLTGERFSLVPFDHLTGAGAVVDDFRSAYENMRTGSSPSKKVLDSIKTLERVVRPEWIHIAGHGLGGALATMLALDIAGKGNFANLTVYTFGSPRVGDSDFRKKYDGLLPDTWRIVNRWDIVPNVPVPSQENSFAHTGRAFVVDAGFTVDLECAHQLQSYLHALDASEPLFCGSKPSPSASQGKLVKSPAPDHNALLKALERSVPYVAVLTALLILILDPFRIISMLLAKDVNIIKAIASWFYLTEFGQRRLFKSYRSLIASSRDLQEHSANYVDLPYDCSGCEPYLPLSLAIRASLVSGHSVEVIAGHGRGKTAVCRHLASVLLKAEDSKIKRVQPVILDGVDYHGNLLKMIVATLRKSSAYVNDGIVESQLSKGFLLIILDGFSEVREAFRGAAESGDVADFVRGHPLTLFLFTSRSSLGESLTLALGDRVSISLKDIDSATIKLFLALYLKNKSIEVDSVISQIEDRLGDLPRIPLMLKLVAAVYDLTGSVPKDRAALFSQYGDYLLRPEVTGIEDGAGLRFSLRYLVRETHLKSGGDRGFSVDEGVSLLGSIRDDIANYGIVLPPIELISLLVRSGLLRRANDYCRFFHDSFESYLAATALMADLRKQRNINLHEFSSNPYLGETWSFFLEMKRAEEQDLQWSRPSSTSTVDVELRRSQSSPSVYLSYAWEANSTLVAEGLKSAVAAEGFRLCRDRDEMAIGARVSDFMREIARADLIIVLLSKKYLHSIYCMRELYGIYQRSLGEGDDFLKRLIPLTLGDAIFSTWEDRRALAEYWRGEYERMERAVADLGAQDLALYHHMRNWHNSVGDMLAYVNDVLQPQTLESIVRDDYADVKKMLLQKKSALSGNSK